MKKILKGIIWICILMLAIRWGIQLFNLFGILASVDHFDKTVNWTIEFQMTNGGWTSMPIKWLVWTVFSKPFKIMILCWIGEFIDKVDFKKEKVSA